MNMQTKLTMACLVLLGSMLTGCRSSSVPQVGGSQQTQLGTLVSYQATQNGKLAAQQAGQQARLHILETQVAQQGTMISYLFTRMPAGSALDGTATPTPFLPVTGSVVIDDGQCCIGGIAGNSIEIPVSFTASSPYADVVDMRYRSGMIHASEIEMDTTPWVPFAPEIIIIWRVSINWVGVWVSVQFRDAYGNLSPIYSDDISVEGMPALPTGTP